MKNVTKKKNGAEPKNKKQMESVPTLLQAIEHVVELSKYSKMSEEFMMEASPEIALLSDRYGITGRQARKSLPQIHPDCHNTFCSNDARIGL